MCKKNILLKCALHCLIKTIKQKEQAMNNGALISTEEQSSWCYASDVAPRT